MPSPTVLTTSQLADAAEVGIQTVRYYEREGLLDDPGRSPSGHRQYSRADVRRLRFIRKAQGLGFQLEEIREILELAASPMAPCGDVAEAADRVIRRIDEKMATLTRMWTALRTLRESCGTGDPVDGCPILSALGEEE